jgi:DNA-directed RNA polymerase subunit RPC12/RpoP
MNESVALLNGYRPWGAAPFVPQVNAYRGKMRNISKIIDAACPLCDRIIDTDKVPQGGLGTRLKYAKEYSKWLERGKLYLRCPHCDGEIISFDGRLHRPSPSLYELVLCSKCGAELQFEDARKEPGMSGNLQFWCPDCYKKVTRARMYWIAGVIGLLFIILLVLSVLK